MSHEDRVRQGINVVFEEPIHKLLHIIENHPAWEEIPKNVIRVGNVSSMRKKGIKQRIA